MNMFKPFMDAVYLFHKAFIPYSFAIMIVSVLLGLTYRFIKQEESSRERCSLDIIRAALTILILLYFGTIYNSIQYMCYFPVNHALKLTGDSKPIEIYLKTIEEGIEKGDLARGAKSVNNLVESTAEAWDKSQNSTFTDTAIASTKVMLNAFKLAFVSPIDGGLKSVAIRIVFALSAMYNQLAIYILQIAMLLTVALLIVKAPLILSMWAWDPMGPPMFAGFFKNLFCVSLWMPTLIILIKLEMLLLETGVMTSSWGGIFKGAAFLLVSGSFKLMIPKFVASLIFGRDISTGVGGAASGGMLKVGNYMSVTKFMK